jgi:hypothetical protein
MPLFRLGFPSLESGVLTAHCGETGINKPNIKLARQKKYILTMSAVPVSPFADGFTDF